MVPVLKKLVRYFADRLDLDEGRIAGWAFVKALGWKCGPEMLDVFSRVSGA
jgi:hypothetical protein